MGEVIKAQVLDIDREKRQLKLSIKQMVPTGIDEFLAEHNVGDTVTGRIIDVDMAASTARVELGEGILATSVLPAQSIPEQQSTGSGPVDLSQLGSLLSAKWKTGRVCQAKKTRGQRNAAEDGHGRTGT